MMIWISYFILGFAFLQLAVAFLNVIFRQKPREDTSEQGVLSVIIPVRNEEKNIENLLGDLKHIRDNSMEIIVFDDESEDRTIPIAERCQKEDPRIRIFHSAGLPEGWLGKNHACHQGAKMASGEALLFLDADVRIEKDVFSSLRSRMQRDGSGLLSVFPTQIMVTSGEKWTVPLMHYILLTLLPLILVRKSKNPALAAANGQFMLFDATVYRQLEPHKTLKDHKVEDIAIARLLKKQKIGVSCLTGIREIQCRMYHNFRDAAAGFSKNIFMFFGDSRLATLLFWLITTFGVLAVILQMKPLYTGLYLGAVFLTRIFVSIAARQPVLENLLGIIPQQIGLGIIIFNAFHNHYKNNYQWKARNISF